MLANGAEISGVELGVIEGRARQQDALDLELSVSLMRRSVSQ